MEHDEDCVKAYGQWYLEKKEFKKKWPHYCETCGGWGGKYSSYDPSAHGVHLAPGQMLEFDECVSCLELYYCPRCSQHLDGEDRPNDLDDIKCSNCNWNTKEEGIPEEPECWCWEEDYRKEAEEIMKLEN